MRSTLTLLVMVVSLPMTHVVQATDKTPSTAQLGQKVPNLTFHDEAGKAFSLYDVKDRKAIVLVFLSFDCPVSKSYSETLAGMDKQYGKHVRFIGLTVNEDESPAQVAKLAGDFKIPFAVFKDEKLTAARALKADATPECFVLDGDFVLRYRGRIDDSYFARLKKNQQVTHHDLDQALGELLSGRPVKTASTVPIGCPIVREEKETPRIGEATYHRDVAPILQNHCQTCHRPGEVGPFSLMTYKQAVNWADDIKSYTQSRQMPPWKISEGAEYHNDRRLNDRDIATLAAWVDGKCPEGNLKDAPPARTFSQGWQLGTPDLVLNVGEDFQLGATGRDLFRCFVLPTKLTEDRYVTGVEIRPGNPRIVHHVLLFIDAQGKGQKLELDHRQKAARIKETKDEHAGTVSDVGPGYTVSMGVGFTPQGGMGGWAPGQIGRFLPEGSGYLLPKNSDVILQVHYHRDGKAEKDRTQIGLYFAKKKIDRPFQASAVAGQGALGLFFAIPAGAERHHIQGDLWAKGDFTLHTVSPHMHVIGKEIELTMTPPNGPPRKLIAIKEWDYNWQETYTLKEPIKVQAGTRFHVDAYYDNSAKNPHNPSSPPKVVTFGEQTFNEMCFVFLGGTSDRPGRGLPMSRTPFKAESVQVPYRLTNTQHVLVRVKINGKGPFNFIIDTGAPIMILSTEAGEKLGLTPNDKQFTKLDRVEIEGGVVLEKFPCLIDTPFQLKGMNGIGLPGRELHGILGYTVLARFRMEFDFTKDKMVWTPLDYKPAEPKSMGGKGGQDPGLEMLGNVMKLMGFLIGAGKEETVPRGFIGILLETGKNNVSIAAVLGKSPAAAAGLKAGDQIVEINGKGIRSFDDVRRLTAEATSGQALQLLIRRGEEKLKIRLDMGDGL